MYKHARLFSTDQKYFVECNKEERPKEEDYTDSLGFFKYRYNIAVDEWSRNCKTVEVHPSEVEKFTMLACDIIRDKIDPRLYMEMNEHLQAGVMLPPDSVRIKSICQYCGGEGLERECHEICEDKFYAFLSEEKESSETQEDSFAIKTFRNVQMAAKVELLLRPEHMNSVFTWKQILDAIMSDSDEHNK